MKKKAAVGIDLGGTKMLSALFDEDFRVVADIKIKTEADKGLDNFEKKLRKVVKEIFKIAKSRDLRVSAIGMGCPGVINAKTGKIVVTPNIPFLKSFPLAAFLRDLTGLDAVLENDARAGLYAEHQRGAAKGQANVLGLFLGTGIGGALIIDHKIYKGHKGTAGEIGQFLIDPIGLMSRAGLGVLDEIVSRHAIAADAAVLAMKQKAPYLNKKVGADVSEIKAGVLAEAIAKGDKPIEELLRSRARIVGLTAANIVNFLSPDMVVLGGGLVEAMPQLVVKEIAWAIQKQTVPAVAKHIQVRAAMLRNHAVTTGAAMLARAEQSVD